MPPHTILADSRTQTLADAKATFAEIAQLEITLAKKFAQTDAFLAQVKAKRDAECTPILAQRDALAAQLQAYILGHPGEFQKPRAVLTDWGRFGIRTASDLEISGTEGSLADWLHTRGYTECIKTTIKLVKPALRKLIEAGTFIPGCVIRTGERAWYEVDKALVDDAITAPSPDAESAQRAKS